MNTTKRLRRTFVVGLIAAGLGLTAVGSAAAGTPEIPSDAVVVSSTDLSGAFTMTATNVGRSVVRLELPAPGIAGDVTVDRGDYDGHWTITSLEPGETATMTGSLGP